MQFTSRELRYFHHKYRGGKSIPAHILDCTLGAILLWALLFFALRFFGAPWRGALLLGLCLCISLGSFVPGASAATLRRLPGIAHLAPRSGI